MSPVRFDLLEEVNFTVCHIEERSRKMNVHEESVICLLLNVASDFELNRYILVHREAVVEA